MTRNRWMTMMMTTALACAGACVAADEPVEPEGYAQIESDELLDHVDEIVAQRDDDASLERTRGPQALADADEPQQAPGDSCTIIDSNGPLSGGTITVQGCDEGELCFPIACGGYSCFGSCVGGGGGGFGRL